MIACVMGGRGFFGNRIVGRLAAAGHDVLSLDITPAPAEEPRARVRHARVDVTDFESVIAALQGCRPDLVVHLSFMRDNLPRPAMKLNVLGWDNVLEASRLCGVSRVLYAGSIAINGGQGSYGERPILETDPPAPRKQYDMHKAFNEWQAKEYAQKHGMSVIGVRVANVSGSDKTIGSVDHVACIVKPAMGQSVQLDYRDRMRCVIHADDAAEIYLRLAEARAPKHSVYNSGGEALSLGQIADMVRDNIPDADITFVNETGGRAISGAYLFNNDRVRDEFGLEFMPYRERIARMIGHLRAGGAVQSASASSN